MSAAEFKAAVEKMLAEIAALLAEYEASKLRSA
jgi:hypothetical protein